MRVNSVFTNFFKMCLAVRCRVAMVMVAIFFIASSFTTYSDRDLRVKEMNVIIREIGHRMLLQAGDSTSRVLPVTEVKEGTFLLRFENELAFSHDSLVDLSLALLPKTEFPSGYIVTVQDCMQANIVYGFQVNNTEADVMPCRGRREFPGCYTIEFAFRDFYANTEPREPARQTRKSKPVKVDREEVKEVHEEAKAKTDISRLAEELRSYKVASKVAVRETGEFKAAAIERSFFNPVYSGMLVLLGVALLIGLFWKTPTAGRAQSQNHTIKEESMPEPVALGRFLFDVKGQRLLMESEVISLTDKECRILELFSDNFNELVFRETLMQKIWVSEGVITGRSLDMFVSKLRKKLSGDPELRITNVHGKGYKLEIAGMQIAT